MTESIEATRVGVDRRALLKRTLAWGGAGSIAATVGRVTPASAAPATSTASYDVACLGDTFRFILHPEANPAINEFRGTTFSVEGAIYPLGTVTRTGFDPVSADQKRIGTWFCRGWMIIAPERPAPHVLTTQEYVLGQMREDQLFPRDTLTSSGLEGSTDEEQTPERAVIGGTGQFAGATGIVEQHGNGTNATSLHLLGDPAPNFRFDFRLNIPRL